MRQAGPQYRALRLWVDRQASALDRGANATVAGATLRIYLEFTHDGIEVVPDLLGGIIVPSARRTMDVVCRAPVQGYEIHIGKTVDVSEITEI